MTDEKIKARDLRVGDVVRLVGGYWEDEYLGREVEIVPFDGGDDGYGEDEAPFDGGYVDDHDWPFELVRRANQTVGAIIDAHPWLTDSPADLDDPVPDDILREREEAMERVATLERELVEVKIHLGERIDNAKVIQGLLNEQCTLTGKAETELAEVKAERDALKAAQVSAMHGPAWEAHKAECDAKGWARRFDARDQLGAVKMQRDAAIARAEKAEAARDWARVEVDVLRGVGCREVTKSGGDGDEVGAGPCGVCLKCARAERDEALARARADLTPVIVGGFGLMEKGLAQLSVDLDERVRGILCADPRELTDAAATRVVAERDAIQSCADAAVARVNELTVLLDEARGLVRLVAATDVWSLGKASDKCEAAVARWDAEKGGAG